MNNLYFFYILGDGTSLIFSLYWVYHFFQRRGVLVFEYYRCKKCDKGESQVVFFYKLVDSVTTEEK